MGEGRRRVWGILVAIVATLAFLAKSLKYQVSQSIAAEHFKSVFTNVEKIERKIYFTDNDYLRTLIQLVGAMEGVDLSPPKLDDIIAQLEADRPTRGLDLFGAVH